MDKLKLRIANGARENSNEVKNVAVTWTDMVKVLSDAKVRPGSRSYMLTGQCPSGVRGSKKGDLVERTSLLMIDFDGDGGGPGWEDFKGVLADSLPLFWAEYSIGRYTGEIVGE